MITKAGRGTRGGRFTTRWADNDVYGHLNNVVYYEFFDSAVNGWLMDATGVDIRELPAIGVFAGGGAGLDPPPRAVGRFVHVYVDAQTRRPVPEPVRTGGLADRSIRPRPPANRHRPPVSSRPGTRHQ